MSRQVRKFNRKLEASGCILSLSRSSAVHQDSQAQVPQPFHDLDFSASLLHQQLRLTIKTFCVIKLHGRGKRGEISTFPPFFVWVTETLISLEEPLRGIHKEERLSVSVYDVSVFAGACVCVDGLQPTGVGLGEGVHVQQVPAETRGGTELCR